MLDGVLARHLTRHRQRLPVRLPAVDTYHHLALTLHDWKQTAEAVLLRDSGGAVRVPSVADLHGQEPWPPRGVLAAADATWVLERDGRVTRLY
jgi:hypothetical protein